MTRSVAFVVTSAFFLGLANAQEDLPVSDWTPQAEPHDLSTAALAGTIAFAVLASLAILCLVFAIIQRNKLIRNLEREPLIGGAVPQNLVGANLNNVTFENQQKLAHEVRAGERLIWAYQAVPRFPSIPLALAIIATILCLFGLGLSASIFGLLKAGEKIPFVDDLIFPEIVIILPCAFAGMISIFLMLTSTLIRISQKSFAIYGITNTRLFILGNTRINLCARYEGVREHDLIAIRDMRVLHTSSSRGNILISSDNVPLFYGRRARLLGFGFYNIPLVNEVREIIESHRQAK